MRVQFSFSVWDTAAFARDDACVSSQSHAAWSHQFGLLSIAVHGVADSGERRLLGHSQSFSVLLITLYS